ncbi:glycoside hydrolase family 30 protein [Siphonobacter sp. SORGH_AS_0500]|uniref:glycoside hydrolase family 30 protein n=1 Tax=Siphonobacter sp. SORGH_AS_0500 TaxID=1864824 RepID=UPI00286508B8|nr:glycoside hydrolase family 30 protein [Siphonobacter sp. SORGH_AS_0500]MDR6197936.1 O-glycosyl hydrolase [Siphonobacter sp. SORGH_AS_0500]
MKRIVIPILGLFLSGNVAFAQQEKSIRIQIDPNQRYQVVEHFGASDAWSGQFIGNWPATQKEAIADLLFSTETTATGQPKGIGLSLWRFNIGAGTAEQGKESGIRDEWRRAEGFLQDDGSYNWNKQQGQLWLLEAAKKRGVQSFLAFTNSPPVQLTKNHKGFATNKQPNLDSANFDKFADFLAETIKGVKKKTGVLFQYVSPVNEPQWDWSDGGQEGTPFFNTDIAGITRSLSKALLKAKLPTKISIAEAGQIDYLYSEHNRKGRQNQIADFFTKGSANYVGNLPNLVPAISGHSYFTTSPYAKAVEKRKQLAAALKPGVGYWMSEYCILGDNEGELNAQGRDLGITPALYIAKVIHNDLVNAQASAWHWWLALSCYDYKDGLVYVDRNEKEGKYYDSKMLWALGQYSRFIRPQATRIKASTETSQEEVLVSAYKNKNGKVVLVVINPSSEAFKLQLDKPASLKFSKSYTTSPSQDMAVAKVSSSDLSIAPQSIVTLVTE